MGAVNIVPRPAGFPGRTVWGRTQGPCAYVGDVIAGGDGFQGVGVYLDERESKQLLLAWGWPTPEAHGSALIQLGLAQERIAELEAEIERMRTLVDASGVVAQLRPQAPVSPGLIVRRGEVA